MEKKTMGAFIAALRKAAGMTQKELAERLYVSDKAVSRWEREESSPDLSVIPALAEVLGVTVDELLRGERKTNDATPSPAALLRAKAQIENAIARARLSHGICSTLSIGIALLGLLAALICNNAFQRATLGFFLACIFFLGALFAIGISFVLSQSRLRGIGEEEEKVSGARKFCLDLTVLSISVILSVFVFTIPLITLPWDAYTGLSGDSWASEGGAYLILYLILALALLLSLRALLGWKGYYPIRASYRAALPRLMRLLAKTASFVIAAELLLALCSGICSGLIDPWDIAPHRYFEDFEQFRAYVEAEEKEPTGDAAQIKESALRRIGMNEVITESARLDIEIMFPNEDGVYDDESTNVDGGYLLEEIYGKDGMVLCAYRNPRDCIVSFQLNEDETAIEHFKVFEREDWQHATALRETVEAAFAVASLLPPAIGTIVYLIKRRLLMSTVE